MNMIFFGKITVFSLVSLSIPVIGVFIVNAFSDHVVEVYGFVESSAVVVSSSATGVSGSASSQGVDDKDKKTLECKANTKSFKCTVWVIDKLFEGDKNHVKWTELSDKKEATNTITLETKKFYKIKTSSSEFDKKQLEDIVVFGKDSKTLGTIKTMFISENNKIIKGKTNIFAGKASKELQTTTGYQCSWTMPAIAESLKPCSIFPFVSADADSGQEATTDDFSALKFTKTTDENSPIKAHHFYLITFTSDDDSKELKDFAETDLIYAKDATTPGMEKITFSKISAVKVVGEQLLILQEPASTSN